jgi:kumamolisin
MLSKKLGSWFAVMLFVVVSARAAGPTLLSDSVKVVEQAPPSGQLDRHKALITRSVLTPAEAAAPLEFEVALKMRNFSELEARIAKGGRISQKEMAARYEPLASDYNRVAAWAANQGLTVTRRDGHHMALFAKGSVSQIQHALQVSFARVSLEGKEYTSAVSAPSVPQSLSPLLVGINGLQPHHRKHRNLILPQQSQPAATGGATYLPAQIAKAYGATGMYNTNIVGSGQAIAIVIDTFPSPGDLKTFWQNAGVSQSLNNIQFIQAVSGTLAAPSGEESLDVEWSSSVAPGAHVRVYASIDLIDTDLDLAYQQVYDDVTKHPEYGIHQMSMSYGEGETFTTDSQMQTDDQYFAELTAAGVTVFASAGDSGSTPGPGGSGDESGPLQVENPASDPNVTGVGGTSLILDSATNVTSETVWNVGGGATGGGVSKYFSRPAWQTGKGVVNSTYREVPDVAASASQDYGAAVVVGGTTETVGGTSWSSPTWAGFCALINEARADAGQSSLGLLGPQIYPLLSGTSYPTRYVTFFRDITSGNNTTPISGTDYAASAGYDLCTGLGAPLVQPLAQFLTGSSTLIGVEGPPAVDEVVPGTTVTFSVAVGGASASYQWQRMPVGSSAWSNLSDGGSYTGSTGPTLTVSNAAVSMSGDQFQCLVNLGSTVITTAPASSLVVDAPFFISFLAGQVGITGLGNGTGAGAQFNYPSGVAVDGSGNIYVADFGNNQIRKVTPAGKVSTPYGSLTGASGAGDGSGNGATFDGPNSVAIDGSNNLYVADTTNNLIRKISGGVVSTLSISVLNTPEGVAVDSAGNVFVADTGNDVIHEITAAGVDSIIAGQVGTPGFADGNATTQALFSSPSAVAVDGSGNVYVADFGNAAIRKISAGTVTTVAGQGTESGWLDGLGTSALFNAPIGLALDAAGNLYIADSQVPPIGSIASGNCLLRKLSPAGVVSTLAGQPGIVGSLNGTGTNAEFYSIQAVTSGTAGKFYFADTYNQTLRSGTSTAVLNPTKVISLSGSLAFGNVSVGGSASSIMTISNTGNTALTVSGIVYPSGFSGNWSSGAVAAGGTQNVTVTFAPASATSYAGNIVVSSDATSGSNSIAVSGTGVIPVPTKIISLSGTMAFGDVAVGGTATTIMTISNTGNTALTVSGIAYPSGFSGNWSSGIIAAGGSQNVTVSFAPTAQISYGGNIVVTSDATAGSNTIATSGAGVTSAISLSGNLAFGNVIVGQMATSTLVISNPGTLALNVSGISYPSGFSGNWSSGTVAAGGSQNVTVTFAPAAIASYGGNINVSSDAANGSGSIAASGTGVAAPPTKIISLSGNLSFGSVTAGQLPTATMTINNSGNTTLTVSGISYPSGFSGNWSSGAIAAGGSQIVTVTFAPASAASYGGNITVTSDATSGTNTIPASGTGIGRAISLSGNLAFGNVTIDQTATAIMTINNVGNVGLSVSGISYPSGFSGDFSSGTIAPGGSQNVTVTFAPTAISSYGGNIAVSSNASGGTNTIATSGSGVPVYVPPAVTTSAATAVGDSSATFNGVVNPEGDTTTVYFQYGVTGTYGTVTTGTNAGAGKAGVTISGTVGSLLPRTLYHYRVVGSNNGGTVYGADRTFTTLPFVSTLVVATGDAAAGTSGARFSALGSPAINALDYVAFQGTLATGTGGITAADNSGIWAQNPAGTRVLVAQNGTAAPGAGGAAFLSFSNPVYNTGEAVAFFAKLKPAAGLATAANASGIWSTSGGSLAMVARDGAPAPGLPSGTTFKTFNALALPDLGGALVLATSSSGHHGIWAGNSTADLRLLVAEGDTVGGKTIGVLSFLPTLSFVNGQTRSFAQGTGALVCGAGFTDKSTGILQVTDTTVQLVAASPVAAAGVAGGVFSAFGNPATNAAGYTAFRATLSAGLGGVTAADNSGIWADDDTGALQLVARTGIAAPGAGATFASLSDPVYNDNEAVAFRGKLKIASGQASSSNGVGVWSNSGGSLALIARQGSQAAGCPAGATFSAFTSLALPDQGGVVMLATLNLNHAAGVTSANKTGIWAVDTGGNLQLIARTGDLVGKKTVTGLSFLPIMAYVGGQSRNFILGTGDLAYVVTFSDKSSAIYRVSFP